MKNSVKAMDHHEKGFQYFLEKFGPKKSDAKLKPGVFVGPDSRDLMKYEKYDQHINSLGLSAWKLFKKVVYNFLGSKKSENYADVVQEMLIAYQKLGCRMSLKIHFLHSHLDFFAKNLEVVSDEHGKRFYQDISDIETRFFIFIFYCYQGNTFFYCYQGKPNDRMMGDYSWYLQGETDASHRRKART